MTKPPPSIKGLLHNQCLQYIDKCIDNVQLAMNEAMQSGNTETKSSAGDKHETGRALLQLEQEKNTRQLLEMLQLKEKLLKVDPTITSGVIATGSAVLTTNGNFYISIAAGKLEIESESYFAISPSSPIAIRFLGLKAGDEVAFNALTYQIRYVL
mgnify:CR=1 FL=1